MSDPKRTCSNFAGACDRLKEGIAQYDGVSALLRDGLIQRFEFTFELAWKALKAVFENEGLIGLHSPKSVLREAFAAGLIDDEELWLAMLDDRNATVHIYNEQRAIEISQHILEKYAGPLGDLAEKLQQRAGY
ncbi:nucleotidyltransferase substrate binding protein like protein [Peptococcaceae bacterium CEB3]|nr:nucleotidyltransferase substrate binding protein like protein [Peptococcaceae bacterium CEB3]